MSCCLSAEQKDVRNSAFLLLVIAEKYWLSFRKVDQTLKFMSLKVFWNV